MSPFGSEGADKECSNKYSDVGAWDEEQALSLLGQRLEGTKEHKFCTRALQVQRFCLAQGSREGISYQGITNKLQHYCVFTCET